jgi:hypothetical protein
MTMQSNFEAAEATVQKLRDAGTLDDIEPAIVQAVLSLASAVDGSDVKADMWREYRAAIAALREAASGGSDDDTASFIVSVQTPRRGKVGDAAES